MTVQQWMLRAFAQLLGGSEHSNVTERVLNPLKCPEQYKNTKETSNPLRFSYIDRETISAFNFTDLLYLLYCLHKNQTTVKKLVFEGLEATKDQPTDDELIEFFSSFCSVTIDDDKHQFFQTIMPYIQHRENVMAYLTLLDSSLLLSKEAVATANRKNNFYDTVDYTFCGRQVFSAPYLEYITYETLPKLKPLSPTAHSIRNRQFLTDYYSIYIHYYLSDDVVDTEAPEALIKDLKSGKASINDYLKYIDVFTNLVLKEDEILRSRTLMWDLDKRSSFCISVIENIRTILRLFKGTPNYEQIVRKLETKRLDFMKLHNNWANLSIDISNSGLSKRYVENVKTYRLNVLEKFLQLF